MKKSIYLLLPTLFISFSIFAQQKPLKEKVIQKNEKSSISECCIMKGGKMYHYHNGVEKLIKKETNWKGMKVMPDGTCKMKNGKSMKLKEGECCDEYGKVHSDCSKLLKKSISIATN